MRGQGVRGQEGRGWEREREREEERMRMGERLNEREISRLLLKGPVSRYHHTGDKGFNISLGGGEWGGDTYMQSIADT